MSSRRVPGDRRCVRGTAPDHPDARYWRRQAGAVHPFRTRGEPCARRARHPHGLFEPELIDDAIAGDRTCSAATRIKVMLPMVPPVDELRAVRDRLVSSVRSADQLGVMVETPAAALTCGPFAAEADFLSIGIERPRAICAGDGPDQPAARSVDRRASSGGAAADRS